MSDLRAWDRARVIGAVDEAQRVGSPVVGSEHLLLATLAEPTVRWAFRTIGVERRHLQHEVDRAVVKRRRRRGDMAGITEVAADAVMQASANGDVFDDADLDAADVSRVLQELARRFLSRTKDSEARAILDTLGVIRCRTRVLATIEHNIKQARLPPSALGLDTAGESSSRSRRPGSRGT